MEAERNECGKVIAGEPYDANDPGLVRRRTRARRLTRRFKSTGEEVRDLWVLLLAELPGEVGTGVLVEPPFFCDNGSQIRFGDHVAVNFICVVLDCAAVRIGAHALLRRRSRSSPPSTRWTPASGAGVSIRPRR